MSIGSAIASKGPVRRNIGAVKVGLLVVSMGSESVVVGLFRFGTGLVCVSIRAVSVNVFVKITLSKYVKMGIGGSVWVYRCLPE